MKKICQTCDHSYMGFGESGCIYHLRCTLKDEGVDEDFTCNEWRNNYSKIIELEQKLSQTEENLKAKEKEADRWYEDQNYWGGLCEENFQNLQEAIEVIKTLLEIHGEAEVNEPWELARARDFLAKIEGITPSK